jgi:hypothetical protein
VPLLPIVDLPGNADYWAAAEHLVLLLSRLARGDIDFRGLPRQDPSKRPTMKPLPYHRARMRRDVTPADAVAFAGCRGLASVLMAKIQWRGPPERRSAPAAAANSLASRLLGIRVDLRAGSLVSGYEIEEAIHLAGGAVIFREGDLLTDRLSDFLDRRLPRVKAPLTGRPAGDLRGSAWSCSVDAQLSTPEACQRAE